MTRRQKRANLIAVLVGLAATGAVGGLYVVGRLDTLEHFTLDLRFQYANTIEQSDRIVCIDIDDEALKLGGRWPWPRRQQAALLSVPAEVGARAILADIEWLHRGGLDAVPPNDALTPEDYLEPTHAPEIRAGDLELRAAIRDAGVVYAAFHYYSLDAGEPTRRAEFDALVDLVDEGRDDSPQARELAATIDRRLAEPATIGLARLVSAIARDFESADEGLAADIGLAPATARQYFGDCLQAALRRRIRAELAADVELRAMDSRRQAREVYRRITSRPLEDERPFVQAFKSAYDEVRSYDATTAPDRPITDESASAFPQVAGVAPVYFPHAEAAKRCGFVVFDPDADGKTRRMPLLVSHGERVLPQLAFGLACTEFDWRPTVERNAAGVVMHVCVDGRRIQVDERGRAVIPWAPGARWEQQYGPRIPAGVLWQIYDRRRAIAENERLARSYRADLFGSNFFADGEAHGARYARLADVLDAVDAARLVGDAERRTRFEAQAAELDAELTALETQMAAAVTDDWLRSEIDRLHGVLANIDAVNTQLADDVQRTLDWLRPRVEGRICLLGYTATALADMTPIPTHRRAPGVLAHANLLNGLVTGRLVRWAPPWANLLGAITLGAMATCFSVWRRPREALAVVLLLTTVYVAAAGWWAFYFHLYWVAITPAVLAAAASTFAIAFYRYVFVERERRQLATALGQYTSPEIARQLAENTDLCRRAEMREVTAMFTDLRGFTSISERIGAERTQRVLNVCLGRVTETIHRHEGMVNKFLGDGAFAFWNPVIYPQPDHARRACEAAIDLQAAADALRREEHSDDVFPELAMRVGFALGTAVVGPCGSEQKFDYTCIGDCVNLASRLESANKYFGTKILLNGAARDAAGEGFVFRTLGNVQVVGKRQGTPVYELIGRRDDVDASLADYALQFERGVASYQDRRWEEAAQTFEACLKQRPEDLAATGYLEHCRRFAAEPPSDDWRGTIELAEK